MRVAESVSAREDGVAGCLAQRACALRHSGVSLPGNAHRPAAASPARVLTTRPPWGASVGGVMGMSWFAGRRLGNDAVSACWADVEEWGMMPEADP